MAEVLANLHSQQSNKHITKMEKKTNNNITLENVNVGKKFADAATWVENLHLFFDKEDSQETYLQNQSDLFAQLTSAIQGMLGREVYWNIIDKSTE